MSRSTSALKAEIKSLEAKLKAAHKELDHNNKVESGDVPSAAQKRLIDNQTHSYSVHFLRRKALRKVKSPGTIMRSSRRFGTRKEAVQHGTRFQRKHGHKDFTVVLNNKRPNAWINWKTGKTNPVINT